VTVVPERAAIRIARDMPLEKAALIGCAVTTGFGGAVNAARIVAGESVAVFGCGGVGLNAVQGAVASAANPIFAVDLHEANLQLATKLGATHPIDATSEDPVEAIKRMSALGVDVSIVAAGVVEVMRQGLDALAPLGRCVILGNAPTDSPPLSFDSHFLLKGERTITASVYGSSNPAADFKRFIELYQAGRLNLDSLVTHRYSLDEANEAFAALAKGGQGRGLIVFDSAEGASG
jgi:S-(hydroxymethyl)glutathione dehydrogenase / alcohol dehydrogenase